MRAHILVLCVGLAGCGEPSPSSDGPPEQVCTSDSGCAADEACLVGVCQPAPLYLLLFTHSEDHINHEPSEERFRRFLPAVSALARSYPEAQVAWTVELMGADAETIAARNPQTGVLDLMRSYAGDPAILFGYHGAHEPTYTSSALASLAASASFAESVQASLEFLTLGKDPTRGGVDPSRPGGLALVQANFGRARIVSGIGSDQAQIHAVDSLASDYVMFGFADHGAPASGAGYKAAVAALMERLCPERRTPCGMLWMDGRLRINDGNPVEATGVLSVDGPRSDLDQKLGTLDATRVQVMNVHIAHKFLYARESPTNYAYAHPDAPELPASLLLSAAEREQKYENSFTNLEYLAGTYLPAHPGSRFVSPDALRSLFVDERDASIPRERVVAVAEALRAGFDGAPPDFVVAEGYYYTLAEAWSLLVQALAGYARERALPAEATLRVPHGPIEDAPPAAGTAALASADLMATAATLAAGLAPSAWQPLPADLIPATLAVGPTTCNAAELLYAMAELVARVAAGEQPSAVSVEPAQLLPSIHDLLTAVRPPRYVGASWSLKPARHR